MPTTTQDSGSGSTPGAEAQHDAMRPLPDAERAIASIARFPSENPYPVMRVDPEGLLLYANASSAPVLAAWDTAPGQPLPAPWRARIAETLAAGTMREADARCDDRDFSFMIVPVPGENYVNLYGRDVTARKRAQQALQLLAEASAALAESLDYDTTLATLAQAVVPDLADWCVVTTLEDGGRAFRYAAVAYADPAHAEMARALRKHFATEPPAPYAPWRVLRTGEPELIPEITNRQIEAFGSAIGAEQARWLRTLAPTSAMLVPLKARGQIHGAMNFLALAGRRRYGPEDLALAEELAHRAAVAIDNARLYAAERRARSAAERATARTARLQEVTSALSEALTPEQVVDTILTQGVAATGAGAGVVVRIHPGDQVFEILGTIGYEEEWVQPWRRFPLSAPVPMAEAVRTGAPVLLSSAAERRSRFPAYGVTASPAYAATAAVPLLLCGEAIGAMGLSYGEEHVFSQEETALLLALAQQCAQALDRAQLLAATQEAVRARERFLAAASHELRTPVTVIRGYLQGLQRLMNRKSAAAGLPGEPCAANVTLDRERLAGILQRSERALARLTALIEEFLDVSRYLQQRPLSLQPEPVDLTVLLRTAMRRMRREQKAGRLPGVIALSLRTPHAHVWGEWDRVRLEQVLADLLDNAVRFSPAGGAIDVRLALEPEHMGKPGGWAHVAIQDQGIGILPGEHLRIFEPFVRGTNASAHHYSGLGIGLALAREIVERHGGSIWAESPGENQGSTVHVVLPVSRVSSATIAGPGQDPKG